jgi:hypothetical protein
MKGEPTTLGYVVLPLVPVVTGPVEKLGIRDESAKEAVSSV